MPRPKRKAAERAERPRRSGRPRPLNQPSTSAVPIAPEPMETVAGALPEMVAPVILTTPPDQDYALLDSGDGQKLERYGAVTAIRPEAMAVWPRREPALWDKADAIFTGATDEASDEEAKGRWAFPRGAQGETWPMSHDGVDYWGRFTAFRHMGVFPEQAAHWRWMVERLRERGGGRVLNLFDYTGVASLAAAAAGAEVTHVDASKKAIGWARENAEQAGLSDAPVRWICEDAGKYVAREVRRGSTYDLVLLDPPKFGRGPNGEVWQLFDHLPALLAGCRAVLTLRPIGIVLTAYAVRASFYAFHGLMGETMRGLGGRVESGELLIEEEGERARLLPTSLFSRWVAEAAP